MQRNLCNGLRDPARFVGAVVVLPLRLVSRLPHNGQRTRRFSHPEPSYPVVYRIATAKAASELGFRSSTGPTQLDAVGVSNRIDVQRGLACSRVPRMFRKPTRYHACSVPSRTQGSCIRSRRVGVAEGDLSPRLTPAIGAVDMDRLRRVDRKVHDQLVLLRVQLTPRKTQVGVRVGRAEPNVAQTTSSRLRR